MSEESSTKKRVEASCDNIRKLHEKDAKNLYSEWKGFHKSSHDSSVQESKLTSELIKLSERSDNQWAKGFGEVAQLQKELEVIQENMNKIIEEEYLIPFHKRLSDNTKSFSNFESKIVKANKDLDANIQKHHAVAQAQRKKDPAIMLKSMEDLTKAVADADVKREEMLTDLNFVEQERYCDWFKTYSGFLQTRLDYHERCLERMKQLKEKWYNLASQIPIAPPSTQWSTCLEPSSSSSKTSLANTLSTSFDSKDSLGKSPSEDNSKKEKEKEKEKDDKKAERGNSFIADGIKKFATLRGKNKTNPPKKTDRDLKIGSPHLVAQITSTPNSIFAGLQPVGKCKAMFEYTAQRDDELSLKVGDVIVVLRKQEDDWWLGILNNSSGVFPSTFVEELPMDDKDIVAVDPSPIPDALSSPLYPSSKNPDSPTNSEEQHSPVQDLKESNRTDQPTDVALDSQNE